MLLNAERLLHKGPEFCQAVKFVIKLQISTLLQQLAESGEESVVLTANVTDGTADRLASHRGAGFLEDHEQLGSQFLAYCAETRRFSVDDESDHLPQRSSYSENTLLSPSLVTSVSPYSRTDVIRARYERESSTSDSVFSPDRRKSSASSKSLEEDVAMLTSQDYPDTPRSLGESSGTWPETAGSVSLEPTGNRHMGMNRSPTSRTAQESEKSKQSAKSPMTESLEHIRQISISSPSEGQYKKYPTHSGGFSCGGLDHQRLPPMFELVPPPRKLGFVVPSSVAEDFKGSMGTSGGGGCGVSDSEMMEQGAINLAAGTNTGGHGRSSSSSQGGDHSPSTPSTCDAVFTYYKKPLTGYSERALGTPQISEETVTQSDSESGYRLVQSYDRDRLDPASSSLKYKSALLPPEHGNQSQSSQSQTSGTVPSEPYSSLTEGREYQSELGEIYRLPKKMESKMYNQRHGSGSGSVSGVSGVARKQGKDSQERRGSDLLGLHSYDNAGEGKEREQSGATMESLKSAADLLAQSDISKSFEEAVKIQQSLFQSSVGMFAPVQRQFIPPGRPFSQRERSQSLSEFHSLASHEISNHAGRARCPSSSFAENLDTPLVIDDDDKGDEDAREGLDLSNKKRKMSADDVYTIVGEEMPEGAGLQGLQSANQGEDADYERMVQGGAGGSGAGGGDGTKKYGKGNFIKVSTGYQCRICCRVIRHMNNTTAHMRIHANVKPYKCQVCNQQFKYEVDRRYHFSKNHVDLFSKMYFPDEKKSN
ncbi:uncharacterized protein LOC127869463 [Dreissena polymorpha]|uniref:C2H2-type domain-containing protein n=1 Tax=Dreissena polymorpha TaxID=45954 RepID=A0A9D4RRA0_DREPO|nr:uncharacterized protein LOC127869463 [Dreissena polymorpha]KAH3875717.1 hypothetical protein DPMN_038993 [Dreissena polymorpha]